MAETIKSRNTSERHRVVQGIPGQYIQRHNTCMVQTIKSTDTGPAHPLAMELQQIKSTDTGTGVLRQYTSTLQVIEQPDDKNCSSCSNAQQSVSFRIAQTNGARSMARNSDGRSFTSNSILPAILSSTQWAVGRTQVKVNSKILCLPAARDARWVASASGQIRTSTPCARAWGSHTAPAPNQTLQPHFLLC